MLYNELTLKVEQFKEGDRAIVVEINGTREFQNFLLTNGISIGTILIKNYSPGFSKLINFSVGGKMLSLKVADFLLIDLIKI